MVKLMLIGSNFMFLVGTAKTAIFIAARADQQRDRK